MSRRKRIVWGVLACLFAVFLGWRFWWTALDHNPQQDECSFGTVSNARYRELLAEAKKRQAWGDKAWLPLRGAPEQRADLLRYRIEDLTKGMTSLYERMAAAHAVMRAAGGHITDDSSTGRERNLWHFEMRNIASIGKPDFKGAAFSFHYALYSRRIGETSLFYPRSWVVVRLTADSSGFDSQGHQLRRANDDEFYVQIMEPGFPASTVGFHGAPPPSLLVQHGLGCPVLPPLAYAEAYDEWSATQRPERNRK
jgi:hypothetical protein